MLRRDFTSRRTLNEPIWLCGEIRLLDIDNHLIHAGLPSLSKDYDTIDKPGHHLKTS